jgi:Mg2+ and Co2+ transporter CorA
MVGESDSSSARIEKYDGVFLDAWKAFLDAWEKGEVIVRTHDDIKSHLFAESLAIMKKSNFEKPYQISVENSCDNGTPDLELGFTGFIQGEGWLIAVEIEWVKATDKKTVRDVEHTMEKLAAYRKNMSGAICYLALFDQSKRYRQELKQARFGMEKIETRTLKNRDTDALLYSSREHV